MEIMKLYFTPDEELYNKRIDDYFDDEVLNSNFWLYWRTMFAFENWQSALEMKLYHQALHPPRRRPARLHGPCASRATTSTSR
jgi:myosin-crossreactive antigen